MHSLRHSTTIFCLSSPTNLHNLRFLLLSEAPTEPTVTLNGGGYIIHHFSQPPSQKHLKEEHLNAFESVFVILPPSEQKTEFLLVCCGFREGKLMCPCIRPLFDISRWFWWWAMLQGLIINQLIRIYSTLNTANRRTSRFLYDRSIHLPHNIPLNVSFQQLYPSACFYQ